MSENDNGARCADHVGEVFPPRCDACAMRALETDFDAELAEITADAKWVRTSEDGSEPLDEKDFAVRVWLIIRVILDGRIPEDVAREVFDLRRSTGSPLYTLLVMHEAIDQVSLQILERQPVTRLPHVFARFNAAVHAYRSVRPVPVEVTADAISGEAT